MYVEKRGNNKYLLICSKGYDVAGKQQRITKTVIAKNQTELNKAKRKFASEVDNTIKNKNCVASMCFEVLEKNIRMSVKATTYEGYVNQLNRIKKTYLGDMRIDSLTPKIIQEYVIYLRDNYSPKTIKNTISLLSQCCDIAVEWDWLATNPCKSVRLPRKAKTDARSLSVDDFAIFMNNLDTLSELDRVLFELALFCGMRRSEIMGLRKQYVHDDYIEVKETRHFIKGKNVIQDTKTTQSERNIALPKLLQNDIKSLLKKQEEEKKVAGSLYANNDYLLVDAFGSPIHPYRASKHLSKYLSSNNIPHITFHQLRHTHATMLCYFGNDIAEVSKQLGHSNISTTLNIYTHIFESVSQSSRNIASEIDDYISKINH